ncbi:PREDICTED: CD177 antigen [Propithecus coquereli]|uniref:CD177 antigen n=1 Tax=Propithecus coquereli TaxID=379532 RepID=UPI00063F9713|nr:PREDICTED: CD177 antigen [Propithecus coquereli]
MSSALLLALLGVTFTLPGAQALLCQLLSGRSVYNVSDLPLSWTAEQKECDSGEGCQDTLMLIENGPHVMVVLSKGCTKEEDHEARVTEHRTGPGLSVVSYTHVCRQGDLCNGLSNTMPVWTPSLQTAPGSLRCPVCFSTESCAGSATEVCPKGSTHCYNGVLRLVGGNIFTRLQVQGCTSQPGCNLLNGTQNIGPIEVRESCDPKDFVICEQGTKFMAGSNLTHEPVYWDTDWIRLCDAGQVCQETLLLIDAGSKSALLWNKGCGRSEAQDSWATTIHTGPPGVLVASYVRFCSSSFCNRANSTSILLKFLHRPAAPAPGNLRCPSCVNIFGSCSGNSPNITCPSGTAHCYDGHIYLKGGGVTTTVGIQGCVAQPSTSLLSHTRNIGIFSVRENEEDNNDYNIKPRLQNGAAPAASLAQVVGLGVALALCCGGLCLSR